MEGIMDKIFKSVNLNRDKTIALGIIITIIGFTLGLSYDTGIFYQMVISRFFLFGISPLGLFLWLYGYYIKFYINTRILFIKCVAFIGLMYIIFYLSTIIQEKYIGIIFYIVFFSGLHLMKKEKLK
jgi:hypothetical protein